MAGGSTPTFWSPVKPKPLPGGPATEQVDLDEPSAAESACASLEPSTSGRGTSPLMARLLSGSRAVADALPSGLSASLSGSFSQMRRRRQIEPPPPPLTVPIRLLPPRDVEELGLEATTATSLAELQQQCSGLAGVPPELQLLRVGEEEPPEGDASVLGGLLRTTAAPFASRRRMQRSVQDWVAFYLVPEGAMRELRGRGAVAWARSLWRALTEEEAEQAPGSVEVAVSLPEGEGSTLFLHPPGEMTLHQLQLLVQQRADIVPSRQVLTIEQRRPPGLAAQCAWSFARLAVALVLSWLSLLGRLLGFVDAVSNEKVRLVLTTESGRQIAVSVAQDMSLRQLAERIEERHPGERLDLTKQALQLSPSRKQEREEREEREQQRRGQPPGRRYSSTPAMGQQA